MVEKIKVYPQFCPVRRISSVDTGSGSDAEEAAARAEAAASRAESALNYILDMDINLASTYSPSIQQTEFYVEKEV